MTDALVVGAGPAGVVAALRAADLGAQTELVTSAEFGDMAANDGPVPIRALAHAGRLLRDARQLSQYGVTVSEPAFDYSRPDRNIGSRSGAKRLFVLPRARTLRKRNSSASLSQFENAGSKQQ